MRTFEENIKGAIQLLEEVKKIMQDEIQVAEEEVENENLTSWQGA